MSDEYFSNRRNTSRHFYHLDTMIRYSRRIISSSDKSKCKTLVAILRHLVIGAEVFMPSTLTAAHIIINKPCFKLRPFDVVHGEIAKKSNFNVIS